MAISLQDSTGATTRFAGDIVSIGRDSSCDLSMPHEHRLQPRHAVLRKMAGRWLVEAAGEWNVQVGGGPAGRKCWVKPNEVIHLTEAGPELVFQVIASTDRSQPAAKPVPELGDHTATSIVADWHYSRGGERYGPVSSEQLKQLAASGQLGPTDLVWREGMAEWQKASSVKGLFPSQATVPTAPPPIPQKESQHKAEPAATAEPAAGRSEKRGLLGTLSSLGHAARTAAVVAAKEAERAKINNVDLPKAYAALGRDVHGPGAYQQEFSDLYRQIDDLLARLRNLEGEPPKQSNSPATFADKAKAAAVATKQKAEAQAVRLQLSRLMTKLGEAVYERHGTAASSAETTGPIAALLSRASALVAEVEQQRQAAGGRFITRRRLAAAGIALAGVIVLAMALQQASKRKIVEADALWESGRKAEAVSLYRDARQFAADADRPRVYGRIIDFDASQGKSEAAQALLKTIGTSDSFWPVCETDAGKQLVSDAQRHREVAASRGKKLPAFRALAKKYRSTPTGDVSNAELRDFQKSLEEQQNEFMAIPFDPVNDRSDAKEIAELYLDSIYDVYDGQLASNLHDHIEPILYEVLDDVKIPQRLRTQFGNKSRRR